ncbi:MAG TPA: SAM-dependent methyltransferase [Acidimicrobiaceae bacterium]|nr:SAM-dependent methyltransferase [Acidimicrobiaceae bacterium]
MDPELHRAHADLDETHWWFRGRRRIIRAVLARHLPLGIGSILDVGCGAGGLLGVLEEHGEVIAIEGEAATAAVAHERHPAADVRVGVLPDALAEIDGCRLVTAFDVIEHVDDDVGLLRAMHDALAIGGTLCVTVPALPSLWSHHDEVNGHKRRYTARTLRAALTVAGFDVGHLSYFNTVLLPVVWVARRLEGLRRQPATDFDRTLGPADRLLEAVFAAERHVVARWSMPLGVSLIAVAVRR